MLPTLTTVGRHGALRSSACRCPCASSPSRRRSRLVEKDDGGLAQQDARKGEPLLLAQGEALRPVVDGVKLADERARARPGAVPPPAARAAHRHARADMAGAPSYQAANLDVAAGKGCAPDRDGRCRARRAICRRARGKVLPSAGRGEWIELRSAGRQRQTIHCARERAPSGRCRSRPATARPAPSRLMVERPRSPGGGRDLIHALLEGASR